MGHDSQRAALIYQLAATEWDRRIADAIGKLVEQSRTGGNSEGQHDGDDGAADDGLGPVA